MSSQNDLAADFYDGSMGQEDELETAFAQGRFIVHARGVRDHTFHEVQIDHVGAEYQKDERTFVRRGTFRDVENKLDDLKI